MEPRPIKADRDHLFVLVELGKTVGAAVDRELDQPPRERTSADLFDAAMGRLPGLLRAASSAGFILAKGEEKKLRGLRRRKIRAATWKHLAAAAKLLDLTRPQLLRALLRMELRLSRELDPIERPARNV